MAKQIIRVTVFLGILLAIVFIHKTGALERILATIDASGIWAPFIFVAVYLLACLFFVPSSVFAFSGGILFGFGAGAALSALGNSLGAVVAFWIGRYLARRWVEKALAGKSSFAKLASALERKGWKIVLLARLSPVFPFSIGNYAFGTTRIPVAHYGIASLIGTIPSSMVYAYLGALTGDLSSFYSGTRSRTQFEWALLGVGLVATLVLFFFLRRVARKALESEENGVPRFPAGSKQEEDRDAG